MYDIEAVSAVRDFVELGGDVLLVIALLTGMMWSMILERFIYYRTVYGAQKQRAIDVWNARRDHASWAAHRVRDLLISENRLELEKRLSFIRTAVALCPMLGLLGTVTGMIEVFDVMAIAGSGNARGMASGVSKATLPTMAGMVAAISGMLFSIQLDRYAQNESARFADSLETVHE